MNKGGFMYIKYLGHSAFEIETGNSKLLIDPFIAPNPQYKPSNISTIFVTHGHSDHLGSAIEISKKQASNIFAVFELANYCTTNGANSVGVSFGGKLSFPWGWAVFMPAFHSSSTPDGQYAGSAASIIFDINGIKIYHAGDNCLNSEMKVLKEIYKPQIAMLPIGGHYTMDIEQAEIAAEWLGVKTVIPMHYNTFPAINADTERFKSRLELKGVNAIIMNKNDILSL